MERIQKYFNRLYRASVLDRAMAFSEHGLSGSQISYILHLCRLPGITQEELASSLFVGKSSVARQVVALEKLGFLTREIAPEDRRLKRCYPTAKAKALLPQVMAYLDMWNLDLTADLSAEEGEQLVSFLRHLAKRATDRVRSSGNSDVVSQREKGADDA